MGYYIIRTCQENELPKLQKFINEHWKENHSLAISQELAIFQHQNKKTKEYNFILGVCPETNEIHGIMGYISTSQYDVDITSKDYWGAIWKIREDIENDEIKLLGLFLWEELLNKIDSFAAIGISGVAKKFYRIARLTIGTLKQYYILREQVQTYKIAKINSNIVLENKIQSAINSQDLIEKVDIDDKRLEYIKPKYKPLKSLTYLKNRYKLHPIYKYDFWFVTNKNVLFITRTLDINESRAIRIVDCLGNIEQISNLYHAFQKILTLENAEYIDCLNYGIPEEIFERIGFSILDLNQEDIIIPNYFEPFLQKNIKIEFAYKSSFENYVIFKGDSDQDRPNIL